MRLAAVKADDVVRCHRRGRRFWARVSGREGPVLALSPISPNISYYRASAREVLEHFARRTRSDGRVSTRAICVDDLIAYEEDGHTVLAIVLARTRAHLRVLPVDARKCARELEVREVTGHYARRGRHRRAAGAGERHLTPHPEP